MSKKPIRFQRANITKRKEWGKMGKMRKIGKNEEKWGTMGKKVEQVKNLGKYI